MKLARTGTYWHVLARTGTYWHVLERTGTYRQILACIDPFVLRTRRVTERRNLKIEENDEKEEEKKTKERSALRDLNCNGGH